MAKKNWTLVDTKANTYLDELSLEHGELGVPGARVRKRTLQGGMQDGLELIEVETTAISFAVLPGRGMGIWKAWAGANSDRFEVGWQSPVQGPVHPKLVPLTEPSGVGWLSGFDELLCRCGLESNGPPVFSNEGRLEHPLHGRIANLPAHKVELTADDATGEVTITGEVDETRFLFGRLRLRSSVTVGKDKAEIRISDQIENLSGKPGEFALLYHINFGQPILEEGSRLSAPVKTVVPRDLRAAEGVYQWASYPAPQAGFAEQVYFFDLHAGDGGDTSVLLRNKAGSRGVTVHYNTKQLPCFTQWKNTAATSDGYVTGLEPGINFPNARPFEKGQGRIKALAAGEKYTCDLRLEVHTDAAGVNASQQRIDTLQKKADPKLFEMPQPGWAAV